MLKELKDLVKETIDKGATSTEEVQKSISNLPFEILTKIAPFADTAKNMKELQTESIGKVYDMIRNVNQKVSEYADNWLKDKEE